MVHGNQEPRVALAWFIGSDACEAARLAGPSHGLDGVVLGLELVSDVLQVDSELRHRLLARRHSGLAFLELELPL